MAHIIEQDVIDCVDVEMKSIKEQPDLAVERRIEQGRVIRVYGDGYTCDMKMWKGVVADICVDAQADVARRAHLQRDPMLTQVCYESEIFDRTHTMSNP